PSTSNLALNAYGVPIASVGPPVARAAASMKPTDLNDRIRVCVRKRPLNKKEVARKEVDIATVQGRTLWMNEPKVKVDLTKYVEQHEFVFDETFDSDSTNDEVYRRTAFPLVEYTFGGGKATCFAYGQTGSGKTFTMLDSTNGLYVKASRDIFHLLTQPQHSHLSAWVSFYEIYQGQLYDLLNSRKKLHAREDGKQQVCIAGLREFEVDAVEKLMQIFEHGNTARSTGATGANADSSRSHAIFQIVLKHNTGKKQIQGKLSFIDLAGSERGADRGDSDKQTRMEGSEINKSLLALKECIRALDQDSKHTPFRQSKLTQVLKDSFIGNSRTCMIATISPNISNSEHSLNTLRYADRCVTCKSASSRIFSWRVCYGLSYFASTYFSIPPQSERAQRR
ncbi:P-loop containing nucleoside triphosphate hydrolase protein, partial [Blyttiomyces helicus]